MLGRRTKRVHPSAGQTTWQYDQASNMTKQTMSSGEYVDYNYNYNQLSNVKYSHRYWNDVWYEYGGANNGNQTGRLVKQQDATGVQEFEYGNMGELIMNSHSYVVPNSSQAFSLTTRWEYDSWNRVKQIFYPDDEKVTYNYNLGGLLQHVEGDKNGNHTTYIKNIEYDEFEQRTAVFNGNNTSTHYDYDPVMRRMTNLTTVNPNGSLLQNEYAYDAVGNIKSIDNVGMNPYHQEYNYDDTYQLVNARGNWSDINNNMADYRLKMTYSPSGKIENKNLRGDKIDQSGTYTLDHNTDYSYDIINPYAVRNTYDSYNGLSNDFDWDVKGNMIMHDAPQIGGKRFFCWTEDNRLQAVKDDKMGAFYNYDASGERNLKLSGGTVDVTQNGYTMNVPVLDEQTLYASALVTINDKGYTKHYFEEGKRICSKIGSGGLLDINTLVDQMEMEYEEQFEKQKDGVIKTYEVCMNITPHIKNENLYENIIKKYEQPVNPDEPVFYYHSDHLGSASYITDDQGDPTQHLVSLPFGEDWVDMKYNTSQFDTPYKFNGKEKDPETGLNYYGARYLNTDLSIWLSVDPMSDKYPHLTSYNYCANNPVMLIDPDGREPVITFFSKESDKMFIKSAQNHNSPVGDNKFNVFAHANNQGLRFKEGEEGFAKTPQMINKALSNASAEWKKSMEKGEAMTVTFFACNMATENKKGNSIAKEFSEAYPNVTVNAANGTVETVNLGIFGSYEVGVKNKDKNGSMITFKNGKEVKRDNTVNYPSSFYFADKIFGNNKEKSKENATKNINDKL